MHLNSASLAGEMDDRRAVIKKENAVECHMKGMQVLAMLAATRRVSTGVCQMVAGCAGRGTDQGDGPWYSHVSDHRRSTLRGETWENPEVVRAAGRLWEQSWRSPALQNLCGAFSFRSKGPTPIPSMQTQ